jgi:enediyne biosynthesis protein E4
MTLILKQLLFFFFLLLAFTQCKNAGKPIFKSLHSKDTGIDFINQLTYSDSLSVLEFEYMFNGAGVALADINNDGLLDIFFAGNMVSSRLYLNKGNLHFEDITKKAGVNTDGWCYGVSVVDINQVEKPSQRT